MKRRARLLMLLNKGSRQRSYKNDVESVLQTIDKQLDRLVGDASVLMDKETQCSELEADLHRKFWEWLRQGVAGDEIDHTRSDSLPNEGSS